nr:MFS transporter [Sedimentibacter sp.]
MYKYRNIVMHITVILFWISLYIYVPILTPYSQEIGAGVQLAGMIIGSYGFTQMIVRIPIGVISDRTGKKKTFVIIGCALLFLSGLGLYLFENPIAVLIFRGLGGIAAGTWVSFTVLYTEYFTEDKSSISMGNILVSNSLGNLLGVFFGGVLSQSYGYASTFIAAFITGGLSFLFSFFVYENPNSTKSNVSAMEVISIGLNKNVLIPSILAIFMQVIIFSSMFGYTPSVNKLGGMTSFQLGLVSTFFLIAKMSGSKISGGQLRERFGFGKSTSIGFILMGIMTVLTVTASSNSIFSYIVHAIGGCGYGVTISLLMSYIVSETEKGRKTIAMGFFQSIYGIGMFAGPVISGYFINWLGFGFNYMILTVLALVCAAYSFLFVKSKRSNI